MFHDLKNLTEKSPEPRLLVRIGPVPVIRDSANVGMGCSRMPGTSLAIAKSSFLWAGLRYLGQALKAVFPLLAFLLLAPMAQAASPPLHRSGTVTIDQGQAGYIVTAGFGGGVLRMGGRSYPFKIGGLGLGGVGVSSVKASGIVYNLRAPRYFAGRYVSLRTGLVVADKGFGKIWLKNSNGVVMELKAQRKGLMLSTGLDGLVVTLK